MRVAYILNQYPRLSETFVLNEILELERQGVDLTVYSLMRSDDGRFHPSVAQVKGEVIYIPQHDAEQALDLCRRSWPELRGRRDHLWPLLEEALMVPSVRGMRELVQGLAISRQIERRGGADHMHAHYAGGAGTVARIVHHLSGVPYSFTAHATDIYLETVDVMCFRHLVHDAAFVATVCESNKSYIELKLLEHAEPKLRRLYHGIDLEAFAPDNTPKSDPPLILAVGQLVEKKGFHVLLKACAALRDQQQPFSCIVIGEGPEHERLLRELTQLRLDGLVELRGARLHDEVRALLRRASLVCVPCVTAASGDRDALPTALLEALASGVPVVSTPVGGVPEVLGEGEGGLLVHENNAFSLASALRYLLGNPGAAHKLAEQGRQRAERLFDLRRNVAELHTLIKHGTPGHGSSVTIVETPPRPLPKRPRPSPLEEFEL